MCRTCIEKYLPGFPVQELVHRDCDWLKAVAIIYQFNCQMTIISGAKNGQVSPFSILNQMMVDIRMYGDYMLSDEQVQFILFTYNYVLTNDYNQCTNLIGDKITSPQNLNFYGNTTNIVDPENLLRSPKCRTGSLQFKQEIVEPPYFGFPCISHEEIVEDQGVNFGASELEEEDFFRSLKCLAPLDANVYHYVPQECLYRC